MKGLVARGNFEISMDWKNSRAGKTDILSKKGGTVKLGGTAVYCVTDKDGNKLEYKKNKDGSISWETEAGNRYFVYAGKVRYETDFPDKAEPDVDICGDVDKDGVVTTQDALFVLKYIANLEDLNETQLLLADTVGADGVTSDDALCILEYVAGILDMLPRRPQMQNR